MKFEQWLAARGFDAVKLTETETSHLRAIHALDAEPVVDYAPHARTSKSGTTAPESISTSSAPSEAHRAALMTEQREIAQQAKSLGLDASEFAGMNRSEATNAMLRSMAVRNATPEPKTAIVAVTRDAGDKLLARSKGAMYAMARLTPEGDEKKEIDAVGGVRSMDGQSLLRAIARAEGNYDADNWSKIEVGMWAARFLNISTFQSRDASATNKISSQFTSVLANVATKALIAGLAANNNVSWNIWATIRNVPNFLAVTNAGLANGKLALTPEDEAFPELNQKDGGYNSQLGLYGATVSLSWQTLVNDQLGVFMDSLRRAGAIAGQTLDFQVYSALLNATWTNDVSATSPLSTLANLDKPRAALKAKKSPTGDKLGIVGRYLLHDPSYALPAQQATGVIYAHGATTVPSLGARTINTVESHWIGDTAINAGALTTDYYLTGDPNIIDTVLVNFLEGVGQTPIIMPFDPGAVAGEKYKIMLPFKATAATHSDGTNTRITGIQKAQT